MGAEEMEEARGVSPQRHLLLRRSDNQWLPIGAQTGWEESGAGAAVRDNVHVEQQQRSGETQPPHPPLA